jgi:hypothetical protein
MKAILISAAILVSAAAVPAIAQSPQAAPPSACLRFGEIYDWKAQDNRSLIVEDNLHKKFKVALMGPCPSLTFKERVGFQSRDAMRLTCMRPGDNVTVRNMGSGTQRCPIRSIAAYTPAMQKADDAAAAPKQQ